MGCGCTLCPGHGNVKVRASVMSAVLFAIVASPQLFQIMQGLLGGLFRVATPSGTPTLAGLILHAIVYGVLVYGIMHLKKRRGGGELRRYGSY